MTYSEKLKLAESFREGTALAKGLPAENNYDKLAIRRAAAHPEGVAKSPPPRRQTGHERVRAK